MTRIKDDIHLGQNLCTLRKQKNLLQADIVRELQLRGCKVVKQNYSRYEKEQEHIPASVLLALCAILDTTLDQIFQSEDPKSN